MLLVSAATNGAELSVGQAAFLGARTAVAPQVERAVDYTTAEAVMTDVVTQAAHLKAGHAAGLDAIVVCAGTNDFRAATPLGVWYAVSKATVNRNGTQKTLMRREPVADRTYRGALNAALAYLHENFPEQTIYLVPPRLDETAAARNAAGIWADDYAQAVREAGNVWAATVVGAAPSPASLCAGRRIAFLGDSITDVRHIGCTSNYWNFLQADLGIVPLVYGINGHQWSGVYDQAQKLLSEHSDDVDAIFIFAGTNDYNANVPLGRWTDGRASFRGRIARVMDLLRSKRPNCPVWLLTPIHRAYATFGGRNVQPDESYANEIGLWLDSYVDVVKEAGAKWGATVVDLHAESGLYPLASSHARFFHDASKDLLHPNTAGHARIAAVLKRYFEPVDSTAHWRAAAEALEDGATLSLPKGEYHLGEADARKMWLDPSNNSSGEKIVVFPLIGKSNVTIDGNGSKLVVHGRAFPFVALGCTNVTIRNLTVTTRYPSCAGFTVLSKDDTGFTVEFDAGACPFAVMDGGLSFHLDGHDVSTFGGRLSLHAIDRIAINYLMTPKSPGVKDKFPAPFMGVVPEDLGGRKVRFRYYGDKHRKSAKLPYGCGEKVVVNLEEKRYRDVFLFEDCRGVRLEDVSIERFGGMGVVAQRSGDLTVERLKTVPPEGERVSLTADIMQFVNCFGVIRIENCEGGWSLDDVLNIHGNYLRVEAVEGRRVRLRAMHDAHEGFFPYRPGDAVEFVVARTRQVLATARVIGVTPDKQNRFLCTLEVDGDVENVPSGALVENVTLNPDVIFRNNRFRNYPNIRVSGRGKYLIEGNRLECACSALTVFDLAEYWYESGRISEMTVRNNDFIDCNGLGGRTFIDVGVAGWGADAPKIHGRIRLENNRFEGVKGTRVRTSGVFDFSEE